ncbi:uncharacterized protein LOC132748877 [Ruditapes philippinarum]|uniref:uncharacterized protein LOC132748877 n=1 Tax=Ruditapes philippinarum TaxID=129788 RepID=UPI00295C2F08|nr:uncharacterized protein LOC132748877 [Ruditapes philippinarum]
MKIVLKLPVIFLITTIVVVHSRVPMPPNSFQTFRRQAIIQHQPIIHHQTIIQHPPIITRTPARDSPTGETTNASLITTSAATTTTTTTEPPELDDDFLPPQQIEIRGVYNKDYPYNYAPTTYGYDYYGLGFGYSGVGAAGGISREVDYDFNPAPENRQQHSKHNSQPSKLAKSKTTTVPTTKTTQTTATVTPELDDDLITSPATGKTANHNQEAYTGYCFCSPLSQCPLDSMPRGGLCNNFLAYFINLKFIRCCYSPSIARSLQL